ncbi:hypothetical protein [Sorangium sp. So ce854]|uniref:hypothetical protein n=1 Tax=Sorangium sp. So ce854 TaxID=3133322 RepID=UPI003F6229B9
MKHEGDDPPGGLLANLTVGPVIAPKPESARQVSDAPYALHDDADVEDTAAPRSLDPVDDGE